MSLALLLAITFGSRLAHGQAQHVRWDIVSLSLPGATVNPGGQASALNNLGGTITLTGFGTFVAPAGGGGTSSAVTGGGTWTAGVESGTYQVTGLVRWAEAPGTFPGTTDNIGSPADFRAIGRDRDRNRQGQAGELERSQSQVQRLTEEVPGRCAIDEGGRKQAA